MNHKNPPRDRTHWEVIDKKWKRNYFPKGKDSPSTKQYKQSMR